MLISTAWADAAATTAAIPEQGSFLVSMLPLLVIFAFFYLLVIRPQSKKIREHQALLQGLKIGDKVVTAGGIFATVVKVSDNDVTLEIASGVHVKAQKHTITSLQDSIPAPANDTAKGKK